MATKIPLRLQILMNLTDLLKTITPANGYQNDLSDFVDANGNTQSRVFRGRNSYGSNDPLPMLSILENPHTDASEQNGPRYSAMNSGPWPLLIQGFVEDDKQNPTDPAHILLADVQMCLGQYIQNAYGNWELFGVGGAVNSFKIGTGVVRPGDEISAYANFWLQLTLDIVENYASPFPST